jgi:hypothetical protein
MIDDEVLIGLVEKYEELYNPKHNYYSNQRVRDNIWDEIGEIMDETGECWMCSLPQAIF